jgi:4-amino-4-deoxy-L-arabinose transferase-like glycosyltransferase
VGIFLYFIAFALYLVFKLDLGISPDSLYHIDVSRIFSNTLGIPENSPASFQWRDITRMPYLYYWINGRLLNMNFFNLDEVIYLRIFNLIYSTGTVSVTYLLTKEILKNKYARLVVLFLLTNSLMFLFLSSSINYDNLANLFAVLSTLYFVKSLKDISSLKSILLMFIFLLLGVLTKFTLAPLAFIFVVILFYRWFKERKNVKYRLKGTKLWILFGIFIGLVGLNIALYGMNIVRYQALVPECEVMLGHEACLENGVYYRDNVDMPSQEVDGLGGVVNMVIRGERLDPVSYTFFWIYNMAGKVVGIMGDSSLPMSNYILPIYMLFLVGGIFLSVKYWEKKNVVLSALTISTIFYLLTILFTQNYTRYIDQGYPALALQGRYMFPVISSFYIVLVYYLFKLKNVKVRNVITILLVVLFFLGCLPYFFLNVPDWWLTYTSVGV